MSIQTKIFYTGLATPYTIAVLYMIGSSILISMPSTNIGSAYADAVAFIALFALLTPLTAFMGLSWMYGKYGVKPQKKLALFSALSLLLLAEIYFIADRLSYDFQDSGLNALYIVLAVPVLSGVLSVFGYKLVVNEPENKQRLMLITYSALIAGIFLLLAL